VTVYVAMLRGINVSGRKKIKMSDLHALFEGLGHTAVTTYIQSGNVVFTSPGKAASLASEIEQHIVDELGFEVPVVLRTKAELAKVIAGNPFAKADLAKVHVTFLERKPEPALVRALDGHSSPPDEFRILGREVYMHCPTGMGKTKLTNAVWERRLQTKATARNWNTVTKLLDLAGASRT
jgi:uncharacterized protein (DUF1697 family)